MRILVLSLLRIGDVILTAPVLRGLRERYPDAQIDLLINAQFRQVAALIPYIDHVIEFDREKLQRGLGEANVPVFDSYERLADLVDRLNSTVYDWAINLTHNRLSGWMMNLIEAKRKTGLCFDHQGRASFGSHWLRYLNHQVESEGSEVFHFTDVFRFALDLDELPQEGFALSETDHGRDECMSLIAQTGFGKKWIAVQPLTSDIKKDWGLERFRRTLGLVQRAHPDAGFLVLAAPFEKEKLMPFVAELSAQGVKAHLAITSFEGAYSVLKRCRLLLTGDTSIKHLACVARIPVVEVSLGSSDLYRTGAYHHGSIIVQSREVCAPCPHSRPCHRASHACAERIPVEAVAMVTTEVYERRDFQFKTIAEEYRDEIDILRVEMRAGGFWAAHSVLETFSEESIGRWIDLACRKIWLSGANDSSGNSSVQVGTEILRLAKLMKAIHPNVSPVEWRHMLGDLERQAQMVEGRIRGFHVGLQYLKGCYEDPRKMREFIRGLISFRERIRSSPFLRSFKQALDQVIDDDVSSPFTRFRRMNDLIHEIDRRTEIHLKLVRGLGQYSGIERGMEKQ